MAKLYVEVGQRVQITGSYSEVMMHFGLAGKLCEAAVVPCKTMNGGIVPDRFMGQIYVDGREFSFPITTSEAGFLQDEIGDWYTSYATLDALAVA